MSSSRPFLAALACIAAFCALARLPQGHCLFFFLLTRLGLAKAITLSFIAPLLIPPLAHLFLGEKMRGPALLAAGLALAGVLITCRVRRASTATGGSAGRPSWARPSRTRSPPS